MPKLTIDNREIEVAAGTKVIEAAERLGIVIPRFCYHPALGSVGACRVCAVGFTDGPVKGVQMSCMVDAQDGMVVSTTDPEAVDLRRHVLEFLMLNHPHDCPVCDEGGHCLLQDLTVAGGHGMRRFQGRKRTYRNQELGPLVQHEMNRCIQCYRCSRYYQEFCGYRDLGVMGIGRRVFFGRSVPGTLENPFAGNLIDICPTGVYTDKPSRFTGRRWDFQRHRSVCIHCSLGCNLTVSARYRQVVRQEASYNPIVNGHFICDRGRYAYAYASADTRPRRALDHGKAGATASILGAAQKAIAETTERFGPQSVAVVASPHCSLETLAVIHHACRRRGWTGPATTAAKRQAVQQRVAASCLTSDLAVSLADVSEAHDALVVGVDPLNEAPMLALALRQVQRRGGRVTVIDPRGVQLPFAFDHWAVHPENLSRLVQALVWEIDGSRDVLAASGKEIEGVPVRDLGRWLNGSPRPVVICGTDVGSPAQITLAADLVRALSRTHITAGLFYPLIGANAFAVTLTDNHVLSIPQICQQIEKGNVRTLVAVEAGPWVGDAGRHGLAAALQGLTHLVVLDFIDSLLVRRAGYFLPSRTVYESGGHWINNEGRVQAAGAVMAGGEPLMATGGGDHPPRVFGNAIPGGDPRPAWEIVLALAGEEPCDAVLQDAVRRCHPALSRPLAEMAGTRIDLKADTPLTDRSAADSEEGQNDVSSDTLPLLLVDWTFGTEPLSALAPALKPLTPPPVARMHPNTMARLGLRDSRPVTLTAAAAALTLPLRSDARMAEELVVVPRHRDIDWQVFGDPYVRVTCVQEAKS